MNQRRTAVEEYLGIYFTDDVAVNALNLVYSVAKLDRVYMNLIPFADVFACSFYSEERYASAWILLKNGIEIFAEVDMDSISPKKHSIKFSSIHSCGCSG
jgi:hypothetical protein